MRILFLLIVIWGYCSFMNAQSVEIVSCILNEKDNTALSCPRYDNNDELCAAVKIIAGNIDDLEIRGSIVGDIIREDSLFLAYLPPRTKRIHLYSNGYIPTTLDFTNYEGFSKGVKEGKTYYVVLNAQTEVKDTHYGKGSKILQFIADVPIEKVSVNGLEWRVNGNISKRLVPYGKYNYEILAAGYAVNKGVVEVKESFGIEIVKIQFLHKDEQ